jgi:hypothetical protein
MDVSSCPSLTAVCHGPGERVPGHSLDRYEQLPCPDSILDIVTACQGIHLKVPKCEIFYCSDFDDFYTIKSLCEGDFGVKIKNFYKNIWGFI